MLNLVSTNSHSITDLARYGEYGFFWYTQGYYTDPEFYGPTAEDAAQILCDKTQDCDNMVFDSEFAGNWVKYKKKFSSGSVSIVTTTIVLAECDATSIQVTSCQEGYGQTPEICDDGFPSDIRGYEDHCDRSPLQQCGDGSFINADELCPASAQCNGYSDCYDFIVGVTGGCPDSYEEIYEYQDPQNFTFTCNQIEPGEEPTDSDLDIDRLASLIDNKLADDFGSVEQAVRDNTEQSIQNTSNLESALDNLATSESDISLDTSSLENAVTTSNSEIVESLNSLQGALHDNTSNIESAINSQGNGITTALVSIDDNLDSINESLNSGECNPRSADYYSCLNTDIDDFPAHSSTGGASTIDEAVTSFKSRIENSELVSSFSGMADLVDTSNAQCPTFSIDLRDTIVGVVASTSVHCELMEIVEGYIGGLMIIIYIWASFRVFASA